MVSIPSSFVSRGWRCFEEHTFADLGTQGDVLLGRLLSLLRRHDGEFFRVGRVSRVKWNVVSDGLWKRMMQLR